VVKADADGADGCRKCSANNFLLNSQKKIPENYIHFGMVDVAFKILAAPKV